MNKLILRRYVIILGAFFMSLSIVAVVLADTSGNLYQAIQSGDIGYISDHIDSFRVYHESTGVTEVTLAAQYGLVGLFWKLNLLVFGLFNTMFSILFSDNLGATLGLWVTNVARGLFDQELVSLVVIIGFVFAIGYYIFKGKSAGLKQGFRVIGTFVLATVLLTGMGRIMLTATDLGEKAGVTLLSTVTKSTTYKQDANALDVLNSVGNQETMSDVIRNSYFNQSMFKVWKIANFGSTDVSNETMKPYLTDKKSETDGVKADAKKSEYRYMSKANVAFQLMVTLFGWLVILLYAIPYIALGLVSWIVTLLAYALIIGLPFLAVLSMFEKWSNSLKEAAIRVVMLLLAKGLLMLVLLLFTIADVMTNYIVEPIYSVGNGTAGAGTGAFVALLVQVVIYWLLLYLMWRYKGVVIGAVTGGQFHDVPGAQKAEPFVQGSFDAVKYGAALGLTGIGAGKFAERMNAGNQFQAGVGTKETGITDKDNVDAQTDYEDAQKRLLQIDADEANVYTKEAKDSAVTEVSDEAVGSSVADVDATTDTPKAEEPVVDVSDQASNTPLNRVTQSDNDEPVATTNHEVISDSALQEVNQSDVQNQDKPLAATPDQVTDVPDEQVKTPSTATPQTKTDQVPESNTQKVDDQVDLSKLDVAESEPKESLDDKFSDDHIGG